MSAPVSTINNVLFVDCLPVIGTPDLDAYLMRCTPHRARMSVKIIYNGDGLGSGAARDQLLQDIGRFQSFGLHYTMVNSQGEYGVLQYDEELGQPSYKRSGRQRHA